MRRFTALLLLLSLSVHCAGRLGIVADWWLNRDTIAKTSCVNRDRPELRCFGKCQLCKRLRTADQREQKQPGGKQVFEEITLFYAAVVPLRLAAPVALPIPSRTYPPLRVGHYGWPQPGLDHPPA